MLGSPLSQQHPRCFVQVFESMPGKPQSTLSDLCMMHFFPEIKTREQTYLIDQSHELSIGAGDTPAYPAPSQ